MIHKYKEKRKVNLFMYINVAIYKSIDIYNEIHSPVEFEDFIELNSPIYQAMIRKDSLNNKKIRFCYITEDFKEFMRNNNLEDKEIALETYMSTMTNEEAKTLWKTSSFYKNVELLLIPFLLIKENIEEITNYTTLKNLGVVNQKSLKQVE